MQEVQERRSILISNDASYSDHTSHLIILMTLYVYFHTPCSVCILGITEVVGLEYKHFDSIIHFRLDKWRDSFLD